MFSRRSHPNSLGPLWQELHDAERRIERLENEALKAQARAEGERDAVQKRLTRRQRIIVTISSLIAMGSGIAIILSNIH